MRGLAVAPALLLLTATMPAFASAPDTWQDGPPVSKLHVLLLLGAIPLGLFLVIAFLVYVPSMARGEKYQPGLAWHSEPLWFGGPSGGLEAADATDPRALESGASKRGGASGRW